MTLNIFLIVVNMIKAKSSYYIEVLDGSPKRLLVMLMVGVFIFMLFNTTVHLAFP